MSFKLEKLFLVKPPKVRFPSHFMPADKDIAEFCAFGVSKHMKHLRRVRKWLQWKWRWGKLIVKGTILKIKYYKS